MSEEHEEKSPAVVNLLSCYFKAKGDAEIHKDAIMLCEMRGDEIQSISLRVAADPMTRGGGPDWAR